MKKLYILIFILVIHFAPAKAQWVTIPDTNFVNKLTQLFPSCMNGNLMDTTCAGIVNASSLTLYSPYFHDLTGIQYFSNLNTLNCLGGNINNIPFLPPNLVNFDCSSNQLSSLPILPGSLTTLVCHHNYLSSLPSLPNSLTHISCGGNILGSLPTLPNSLQDLDCSGNHLTNLPPLPSTLVSLLCSGNLLTNLPNLPNSLKYLEIGNPYLEGNLFSSLPLLPNGLIKLDCSYNYLTSLANLPNSIEILLCKSNQINNITTLPNSLKTLDCTNNQLYYLPTLPNTLEKLFCSLNYLSGLPLLPNSLWDLRCFDNQITSLPPLPSNLLLLGCGGNQLTSLPPYPNSLYNFNISNNNISCLPFLPQLINSTEGFNPSIINNPLTCVPNQTNYSLGLPLCLDNDTVNNPNNCLSTVNIAGYVYTDLNNNCTFQASDLASANIPVQLYDSTNTLIAQNFSSGGTYGFMVNQAGNYKVKIQNTNIPIAMACAQADSQLVNLISPTNGIYNVNFPIQCIQAFDVEVQSINSQSIVFPGQIHTLNTNVTNNENWYNLNCTSANYSGIVTIQVIGPITYVSPMVGALTPIVVGNTFTYNVSNINSLNSSSFGLRFLTDSTAQAGNQICVHVSVVTNPTDVNTINNVNDFCYTVVNSYDPNMKEVYPVDVIPGYDDWLTYTIHFQNTGNAPAFNIRLRDTLDSQLDLNTFEVLGYSHPAATTLSGNVLSVRFNNIMLEDSTSNYEGSMGYFQYRIKPQSGMMGGSQISNTAYIYFDYNAPIVTNTTQNNFNCLPINVQQSFSICIGDSVQVGTNWYSNAGNFTETFVTPFGCDSIVSTTINQTIFDTSLVVNGDIISANPAYSNYEWINCSNDSTIQNSVSNLFIIPFSGDFKVKITSNNGCNAVSSCMPIIQTCQPINAQQSLSICYGDSVQVGTNWYSNEGNYTDTFVTSFGCDSIVSTTITQIVLDTSLLSNGDTISANPSYSNYEWINCANDSTIQNSTSHQFVIPFSGDFKVKITSNNGCTDLSPCLALTQTCQPINAQQSLSICIGDSVQVGTNWYSNAGTYSDTFVTSFGCDSIVNTTITETTIDTSIVIIGDTLFATSGYLNYSWMDCSTGLIFAGANSNVFIAPYSGFFRAVITSSNECNATSSCIPSLITRTLKVEQNLEIKLIPNPAQDYVSLISDSNLKNASAQLIDINGNVLQTISLNKLVTDILLYNISAGIYYIKVYEGIRLVGVKKLAVIK